MALTPKILFEDTHLVVLAKPAGLLSQGEETGAENLVDWLRDYFGRHYVGLVHRLDRNTSGLMVVAKRSKSADRLSEALREGSLTRIYLAILQGTLSKPQSWRHFLEKNEATNTVRALKQKSADSKEAALSVSPIKKVSYQKIELTLARFELETGRSHQIRVQAATEGFPLVGDIKYGAQSLAPILQKFPRPALHSSEISFPHPKTHEIMHFEEPLPADMNGLLVGNSA